MERLGETDEVLWSRCANDDPEALGQLFDRYADAVFRYCLSRTGSWQDAEDLVSVTFLEAWGKRRNLVLERDSLLPWLLGVATNAMRNRSRSRRRYHQFLAKLPHSPVEPDHSTATAERLDAEEQVRELLAAATSLTGGRTGRAVAVRGSRLLLPGGGRSPAGTYRNHQVPGQPREEQAPSRRPHRAGASGAGDP